MASAHGRKEQAGNNYAQEDAPRPLWCIEDYCVDLTREDWTRSGDLETQEQDDNNIHRLDKTADFEVEDRVKSLYSGIRSQAFTTCISTEDSDLYFPDLYEESAENGGSDNEDGLHMREATYADPETGLQQEEEPDFCRQGYMKEDGKE
ncbi:hypothetical protein Bbelb_031290 [Branchiostoma belcheri]|nr:hypothetical protein Bbelb_031290 [Branchiostoma belcheri]